MHTTSSSVSLLGEGSIQYSYWTASEQQKQFAKASQAKPNNLAALSTFFGDPDLQRAQSRHQQVLSKRCNVLSHRGHQTLSPPRTPTPMTPVIAAGLNLGPGQAGWAVRVVWPGLGGPGQTGYPDTQRQSGLYWGLKLNDF